MAFTFKVTTKTNLNVRSGAGTGFGHVRKLAPGTTHAGYEYKNDSQGNPWIKLSDGNYCCQRYKGENYVQIINANVGVSKPVTDTKPTGQTPVEPPTATNQSTGVGNGVLDKVERIASMKNMTLDSAIDGSVRLFGLPHQFLPYNDTRISDKSKLGRKFAETIVLEAPSLFIKPGTSRFLPDLNDEEKKTFVNALAMVGNSDSIKQTLVGKIETAMNGDDPLKYFEHKNAYSDYMTRVNMLARTMAVFLKIDKEPVPWAKGVTFGLYDWRYYKFKSMYVDNSPKLKKEFDNNKHTSIGQFLDGTMETVHDAIMDDYEYIQFYIDAGAGFSESANNSTQASMLDGALSSMEGMSKELYTLTGMTGIDMAGTVNEMSSSLDNYIQTHLKGENELSRFIKRFTGGANQMIAGGNFIIPEIWSDSAYSKSYNISLKLSTPYGNVMSWFLNIGIPMVHILAAALPQQISSNVYKMPYLIKAFSPGWFSIEMGMIDSIAINKGGSGDAWNARGLCNEMTIDISIKDLYSSLAIPSSNNINDFMNNTGLLEFLMTNCGVDLTKPDMSDKLSVITNMFAGKITETITKTPYDVIMGFKNFTADIFKILD